MQPQQGKTHQIRSYITWDTLYIPQPYEFQQPVSYTNLRITINVNTYSICFTWVHNVKLWSSYGIKSYCSWDNTNWWHPVTVVWINQCSDKGHYITTDNICWHNCALAQQHANIGTLQQSWGHVIPHFTGHVITYPWWDYGEKHIRRNLCKKVNPTIKQKPTGCRSFYLSRTLFV